MSKHEAFLQPGGLQRRGLLAGAAAATLGAPQVQAKAQPHAQAVAPSQAQSLANPVAQTPQAAAVQAAAKSARWIGANHERGHALRPAARASSATHTGANSAPPGLSTAWADAKPRQTDVLVLGAGVAGLSAARALARQGVDGVQVLDLEDEPGGNARSHHLGGMSCPLGAHYLPVPDAKAPELRELVQWLFELGLLRMQAGVAKANERHLVHMPAERLFFEGQWVEGLLPPAEPGSARLAQYQRLEQVLQRLTSGASASASAGRQTRQGGRQLALPARTFTLPAHRGAWTSQLAALDGQTFSTWLASQGIHESALLTYLDYACRDDYGAGIHTVSAWAGVHYFASRHGFQAPASASLGTGPGANTSAQAVREAVFAWPEGNSWLTGHLSRALAGRIAGGRVALAIEPARHQVRVLVQAHEAGHRAGFEAWSAKAVVVALPLFIAQRLFTTPPAALAATGPLWNAQSHAPWLVSNIQLAEPLLDRIGAPPAWDNVVHGAQGLGYVDAMHQSFRPHPGPTVITAYQALPSDQRGPLLRDSAATWATLALQELAMVHPDLPAKTRAVQLMRYGHAMVIPRPGLQRHRALMGLRALNQDPRSRIRFAHSDLAGYSVFEEAFTAGAEAGALPPPA